MAHNSDTKWVGEVVCAHEYIVDEERSYSRTVRDEQQVITESIYILTSLPTLWAVSSAGWEATVKVESEKRLLQDTRRR